MGDNAQREVQPDFPLPTALSRLRLIATHLHTHTHTHTDTPVSVPCEHGQTGFHCYTGAIRLSIETEFLHCHFPVF